MMPAVYRQRPHFAEGLRGQLMVDAAMSKYTSWRVGGKADYLFTPADEADLVLLLSRLPPDCPRYWVGLGSNLLVRDRGIEGMVIRSVKGLTQLHLVPPQGVFAEAGVASAQLARFAVQQGLTGAEFLAGIPGSWGGALAMNAGAFGTDTWQWVRSIRLVDRCGGVTELPASAVEYGYRRVVLPPDSGVLSAVVELQKLAPPATAAGAADAAAGRPKIRRLLGQRNASQPLQSANAGSVFKNPPGDYAGRLLQQAGLPGRRVGGAEFSHKHANFIVNRGDARAQDIETLIELAQQQVQQQFGVWLETEVCIVGRA